MPERARVCLNMIVKNETRVLPRLFESVKDAVDCYVIVDTGSEDGTPELIKELGEKYGISGEVHHRKWVNFGHNRQEALELAIASKRADWMLFIDADEELVVKNPNYRDSLDPRVVYEIEKHHGEARYSLPQLVNIKESSFEWRAPVHNYLEQLSGPNVRQIRKDIWIKYHAGQGAKSHGLSKEEKYLKDAKILLAELEKNPQDTRSQFYLAQSYFHAGHYADAMVAYKKRAQMGGWEEEVYYCKLMLTRLEIGRKAPEGVILTTALDAYNYRPARVESLYELSKYYRKNKEYGKAFPFALAACSSNYPHDRLFVGAQIYQWRRWDELGICGYWVGQPQVAKDACERALKAAEHGAKVSEQDAKRIRQNLEFSKKKLAEAVSEEARRALRS